MNGPDFVGIVFIVIGLLLLIPTVYVGWVFVLAVGLLVSLGIFIIIEMGELFRNPEDVPAELLSDEKLATNLVETQGRHAHVLDSGVLAKRRC